jgi:hypothetical protein
MPEVLLFSAEGVCFLQRGLPRCAFVESEAEESGSCSSSDNDDTSGLDDYDSSFVSDSGDNTHTDIQAKFLHSLIRYVCHLLTKLHLSLCVLMHPFRCHCLYPFCLLSPPILIVSFLTLFKKFCFQTSCQKMSFLNLCRHLCLNNYTMFMLLAFVSFGYGPLCDITCYCELKVNFMYLFCIFLGSVCFIPSII